MNIFIGDSYVQSSKIGLDSVSLNKTDTFIKSVKMKGISNGGSSGIAEEIQCGVQG